jgi:hypothetical protein
VSMRSAVVGAGWYDSAMPFIDDAPEAVTPAGQAFDYVDPPVFATITLVNAPLDPDHSNIGVNPAAYGEFIDAEIAAGRAFGPVTVNVQNPDHDIQLEVAYEEAVAYYNYGRLVIDGRAWYIFYTPEYLNKQVTRFVADIDEVASYSWTLGYSPVVRGHIAVAASVNDTYGDQYLTAPEPLSAEPVRGILSADILGSAPDAWTVLVVAVNDLKGDQRPGSTFAYFDKHVDADLIESAARLASAATIDSAGTVQATIATATYPWNASGTVQAGLPLGTPTNGYVPDGYLTTLLAGSATQAPDPAGTIRAELNTAAAWAALKTAHPEAHLNGSVAAYWSRALDIAIHNDPAAYGITDPTVSPIGHSAHGLGIRLNIGGVDPSIVLSYGFTEYNSYTFTWPGPYSWDTGGPPVANTSVYVPKVTPAPVSVIDGVAAGGGVYLFTLAGFAEYMSIMQGAPWVTSGIIDVRLVPSWAVSGGGDAAFGVNLPSQNPGDGIWDTAAAIPVYRGSVVSGTTGATVLAGWRETVLAEVGAAGWRKLVTAQFTSLIVGNGDAETTYAPDQWDSSGLDFSAVTGAANGDPSIRLVPASYNQLGRQRAIESAAGGKAGLTHSGFGLAASNPASQDLTPYLNAFSSFATWSQTFRNKALAISLGLTGIQLNAGVQGVQTVLGAAQAAAGGALAGGIADAKNGALQAGIGGVAGLATAGMQASNAITLLDASKDGSFDIAVSQLALASQASVDVFDTWYQGLSSVSGSGVAHQLASAWRWILGQTFQAVVIVPSAERIRFLLSEWKRYGYMIGQTFTPPRLDVMSHMSYWQTAGAVILGPVPQQRRQTIAAAFDSGVTIWQNIAEIGTDVRNVNTPTPGVTY